MLEKILESCKYVVDNTNHVKINYKKANDLLNSFCQKFDNIHYLTKVPYNIYGMSTENIVNFLLIYDSIDFSFGVIQSGLLMLIARN